MKLASRLSDLIARMAQRGIDEDDVLIDVDSIRVVRGDDEDEDEED